MSYTKPMITLYHGTSPRKLKTILRRGLVPSDRYIRENVPHSDELEEGDKVVWLTNSPKKARNYGSVILKVEVDPKYLTMDDLRKYSESDIEGLGYLHWERIPSKAISVLK